MRPLHVLWDLNIVRAHFRMCLVVFGHVTLSVQSRIPMMSSYWPLHPSGRFSLILSLGRLTDILQRQLTHVINTTETVLKEMPYL